MYENENEKKGSILCEAWQWLSQSTSAQQLRLSKTNGINTEFIVSNPDSCSVNVEYFVLTFGSLKSQHVRSLSSFNPLESKSSDDKIKLTYSIHCFLLLFDRYVFFLHVDIVFGNAFHVHNRMSLFPFLYMNCSSDVSLIQFSVNRLIFSSAFGMFRKISYLFGSVSRTMPKKTHSKYRFDQ